MSKKGENFFEQHIEKIVLAIVGVVCVWLLFSRVVISPNVVIYDNKKFNSGDIDNYVLGKHAERLKKKLDSKTKLAQPYKPKVGEISTLIDSAVSNIDTSIYPPQPIIIPPGREFIEKEYDIPQIGEVTSIKVEHIRAVAYMPIETIGKDKTYDGAETELNDLDLVTVEARFDAAGLYERFYECFAGDNIPDEWRDPCLAAPVFAAVQLQRQQLRDDDGGWSDWQIVPKTRIEHRKEMFEIVEEFDELPAGGMKVRLLQFDDPEIRMAVLQPLAYEIASAREQWFPPGLHRKFLNYQQIMDAQERREAKAARKQEQGRDKGRGERRSRATRARSRPVLGSGIDSDVEDSYGVSSLKKGSSKKIRLDRAAERERLEKSREASKTIDDIYNQLNEILIVPKTHLAKMKEPLLFWGHDDTIEEGKTYRYRIRLGVFNALAGKDQFTEQYESMRNKTVLWSEFCSPTKSVEIPRKLCFFPLDVQDSINAVTMQVCRYVLGYWYSENFIVKEGEVIGDVVMSGIAKAQKQLTIPQTIDYSTGAVLVNVVPVNDWSGGKNLKPRYYRDMLYSYDGTHIAHVPIRMKYWPDELKTRFNEIKKSEKEPRLPLRERGSWLDRRLAPGVGRPEEEMDIMDIDTMGF